MVSQYDFSHRNALDAQAQLEVQHCLDSIRSNIRLRGLGVVAALQRIVEGRVQSADDAMEYFDAERKLLGSRPFRHTRFYVTTKDDRKRLIISQVGHVYLSLEHYEDFRFECLWDPFA